MATPRASSVSLAVLLLCADGISPPTCSMLNCICTRVHYTILERVTSTQPTCPIHCLFSCHAASCSLQCSDNYDYNYTYPSMLITHSPCVSLSQSPLPPPSSPSHILSVMICTVHVHHVQSRTRVLGCSLTLITGFFYVKPETQLK